MTSVDQLINFIAKHFPFDETEHAALKGATDEEKRVFAIRHVAMHHAKTAGKIITVMEEYDHTQKIDEQAIKENIPKAIINTLRLAELVGIKEEEIVKDIELKYNAKLDR